MTGTCPTPAKVSYPTRWAALRALLKGAKGRAVYPCRGHWHTTSRLT